MRKRRKILIDKRYQLKTAFVIIGIVYFLLLIAIAGIVLNAAINNKRLSEIIERQKKTIQTQRDVLDALFVFSREKNWKNLKLAMDKVSGDININLNVMNENTLALDNIAKNNIKLLYAVIVFIIFQGCILYYILIKKTHRIAGPIYHISEYIRDMINGRYPKIRPLRKNDELKEFHDLIVKMVESFRQRQAKKNID